MNVDITTDTRDFEVRSKEGEHVIITVTHTWDGLSQENAKALLLAARDIKFLARHRGRTPAAVLKAMDDKTFQVEGLFSSVGKTVEEENFEFLRRALPKSRTDEEVWAIARDPEKMAKVKQALEDFLA